MVDLTEEERAAITATMKRVALLMDGGTASVYGPRAWAAFEEFAPSAAAPVA